MPSENVSGVAVGCMAFGTLFVYAGIKGYSIPQTLQDVVSGKSPLTQPQLHPIGTPTAAAATPGTPAAPVKNLPVGTIDGDYTSAQLESLWVMAGGSQATAANAACHAIQESSGSPIVTSANPDGGTNVGLWQLDTKGKGVGHTVAQLQNALTNARITVSATSDGADWSAWSSPGCPSQVQGA